MVPVEENGLCFFHALQIGDELVALSLSQVVLTLLVVLLMVQPYKKGVLAELNSRSQSLSCSFFSVVVAWVWLIRKIFPQASSPSLSVGKSAESETGRHQQIKRRKEEGERESRVEES